MQTPSIFEDPKIHSLVYKEPVPTSGAGDALYTMQNQVDDNKKNIDTAFTHMNINATAITAVKTRVTQIGPKVDLISMDVSNLNTKLQILEQKLDKIIAVANGNQEMIKVLVGARS